MGNETIVELVGIGFTAISVIGAFFVQRYQVKRLLKDVNGLGIKFSKFQIEFATLKGFIQGKHAREEVSDGEQL